jgi:transposase
MNGNYEVNCMNSIAKIDSLLHGVKDRVVRERLLVVRASYRAPLRDVAKIFGCTHGKVAYWLHRFEKEGIRGLSTREHPGRPKKIKPEQIVRIKEKVSKHDLLRGWRTKRVRELIVEETGVRYSNRQTIRILQSWNLVKIRPRPRFAFSKKEDREAFLKKTSASSHISHSTLPLSARTKASSSTNQ